LKKVDENFQQDIVEKLLKEFGEKKSKIRACFLSRKRLWKRVLVTLKFSTPSRGRKIAENAKKLRYNAILGQFKGFPQFPQALLL
jgi:hypothetical protein